jgi:hypothetical protein
MRLYSVRRNRIAVRVTLATTLVLALLLLTAAAQVAAQEKTSPAKRKVGLLVNEARACKGYTLIASSNSTTTYLVDMEGRVVNTWKSDCLPGLSAYLLPNGNLLRTGQVTKPPFFGGGTGGRIQEFSWDGKLVWDYTYVSEKYLPNHDICKLPNGNVLMIAWEKKAPREAVDAGRRPETVGKNSFMLADCILEVQPTGEKSGKIVWEWRPFDHLVQDFDKAKANYGDVAAHPELIDINFGESTIAAMVAKPEELEKLRAIGYVGGAGRRNAMPQTDWLHVNAVAYNAELDQIMLSVFEFNEIWIIDHSTTKDQAAGHTGGKYSKGGDLLYRWGNPRSYRAGTVKNQTLFGQHNSHWIEKGLPGAGNVLVFNNGLKRTGGAYSTVDEIVLPVNEKGEYEHAKGKAFGPEKAVWSYAAPKKNDFYAPFISGAQRLPNGNTLVCSGTNGTIFEVTPKDEIVWKYLNPTKNSPQFGGFPGAPAVTPRPAGGPPGGVPFGAPPKLGTILPSFLQGAMRFTSDQKKDLGAIEKDLGDKLGKLLTDDQKKQFAERPTGFDPRNMPLPGELIASGVVERLKLADEQKKQLAEIQKDADARLGKLFTDAQKKQFKQMVDFSKTFRAGPRRPGGPGGPGFGMPGFGPAGGSGVFRAPRYGPDYPGLAGKKLTANKTIEELETPAPKDAARGSKDK